MIFSEDQPQQTVPRKLSLSGSMSSSSSPLPNPRVRVGFGSNFDGVLNGGDSWVARRKASEGLLKTGVTQVSRGEGDHQQDNQDGEVKDGEAGRLCTERQESVVQQSQGAISTDRLPDSRDIDASLAEVSTKTQSLAVEPASSHSVEDSPASIPPIGPPPGIQDLASVEWSYLDPQGHVQGWTKFNYPNLPY
jgi:PERQ amino acid-rich with GYF domain-containing protein